MPDAAPLTPCGTGMTIAISPLSTKNPPAKRILVVDDDSSVLRVVTRALDAYDLLVARGGVEALALATRTRRSIW